MEFTVVIDDSEHLAGITWAREQYNASLPQPMPPPDPMPDPPPEPEPVPPPIETDQEYVQWVMSQAAASYAISKHNAEWRAAAEADAASRGIPI